MHPEWQIWLGISLGNAAGIPDDRTYAPARFRSTKLRVVSAQFHTPTNSVILCRYFQLVISHRSELLSGECEMSTVHHLLCSLPKHIPQSLEQLIEEAHGLFKKYSPQKLEKTSKKYLKERWENLFFEKIEKMSRKSIAFLFAIVRR